jgi:hypothetical protein
MATDAIEESKFRTIYSPAKICIIIFSGRVFMDAADSLGIETSLSNSSRQANKK